MNLIHSQEEIITFKSIYNFRSLGGHPLQNECVTSDRFFRSDCLLPMDSADIEILKQIGIGTVIDLRNAKERKSIPSGMANTESVNYYTLPFINEEDSSLAPSLPEAFTLSTLYSLMLENSKPNILKIFQTLSESSVNGPVLFHCTAGKDRTGLVAALLLDLAGVNYESIVQDYNLTEYQLANVWPLLVEASGMQAFPPKLQQMLLNAAPEQMKNTLAYLYETYGGAQEYLLEIGLNSIQCEILQQQMQKG